MALAILVVLYAYLGLAAALSKEEWRSQSIYQLLTDRYAQTNGSTAPCGNLGDYCGGSWQGITNNLDYIQDMGFTAIWISPITEQIPGITYEGAAYHGFWPQQINQVNSNFGTAADLKDLSNALHQRGMYLMVDMVTNDMAWNGNYTTVDFSIYDVFNDSSYYHPYCPITDYQNSSNAVECWSGDQHISLPDLATENSVVLSKWEAWVSNITKTYGIDGIRLDACLEQNQQFFTSFESAAGMYVICEVYDYPIPKVCDYQNYVSGLLNFPVWYLITDAFGSISGSITNLYNGITEMQGNCTDVSLLGNFVENHDVDRLPYTVEDIGLDQNAIAFAMLNDGIPIIYAGEEQHYSGGSPPADRETTWTSGYNTTTIYYQLIKKINALRACLINNDATYLTTESVPFFLDTQVLAVKKGSTPAAQLVGVYNNRGTGAASYTINMENTGWTAGDLVYEIYTEQTVTVATDNTLPVYMYGGQPRMYYLQSSFQCPCADSTNVCLPSISATTATPTSTSIVLPTTTTPSTSTSTVLPTSTIASSSVETSSSVLGSSSSSPVLTSSTTTAIPTSTITTSSIETSSSIPGSPSSSAISSSSTTTAIPTSTITTSSIEPSSSVPGSSSSLPVLSSSTTIAVPTSTIATTSIEPSSSVPGSSSSSAISSSSTTSSTEVSSSVPGSSNSSPVLSSSTTTAIPTSTIATSSIGTSSYVPGSSSSSAVPSSSTTSSAEALSSVPGSSSSSAVLPSSTISSAEASILPFSSSQITSSVTSVSGNSLTIPASASLSATVSSSAAPAPATAAPICPSADGSTFTSNGQDFVVGCGIASDQAYFTRITGTDIADCVHICTTFTGTPVCEAVTYSDGFCYLKSDPGAVYNEAGSDSAFVISTLNGPETIASGYLSGNISQSNPACPDANGNTFEFNGYVYVVGCSIDNYVVDISTAPGADLATCVESCISFSGTQSCAAVTYNNGSCHFKASVGTVFPATGAETAFIIANNATGNPVALPPSPPRPSPPSPGNPSPPPNPNVPPGPPSPGNPSLPSNPNVSPGPLSPGNPSLPPNPTGTYTVSYGSEIVVYVPLESECSTAGSI